MKYGLTPRQQEIYDALVLHHKKTGMMPTVRELARAANSHPSAIHYLLGSLQDKGYIARLPGRCRGLSLVE